MKQCADIADLLSAYADGQAVPAQVELLEQHLERCSHCRATLRWHRETLQLLTLAEEVQWDPPDLRLRIAYTYAGRRVGAAPLSVLAGMALSISVLVLMLQIASSQHVGLQAAAVAQPSPSVGGWTWMGCRGCLVSAPAHNVQLTAKLGGSPRTTTAIGTNGRGPAIRQMAQDAQAVNDQMDPAAGQVKRWPIARSRSAGPVPM